MVPAKLGYILAASHSGSTLLALLLGSHPRVCTVGEIKLRNIHDPDEYLCSCRTPLVRCEFWSGVTAAMRRRGFAFTPTAAGMDFNGVRSQYARRLLRPLHRGPIAERLRDVLLSLSPEWRTTYSARQERNAVLVEELLALTGSEVVVDSSKTALRAKYLSRNRALDVRVIRLVRDGRGAALTYMEPSRFADAADPTLRGGGTGRERSSVMSMQRAAAIWRRSNEDAEALLRTLPSSAYIRVRYEDLCRDTPATLAAIFAFLGVDPNERPANFRSVPQHVVGNGMRLDSTEAVVLDERWKDVLTEREREDFAAVAGDLNRSYGYS